MHAQGADNFAYFKKCRAYETALELMEEGKFRHFGISFHDRAEVLEQILTEYPQIEVVQIQSNQPIRLVSHKQWNVQHIIVQLQIVQREPHTELDLIREQLLEFL